jgi:hypothetical protein
MQAAFAPGPTPPLPGFANIESDEEIWELTLYVRSLRKQPKH